MAMVLRRFLLSCFVLIASAKGFALTLDEALVAVYKNNLTLQVEREKVKQTDEQIMQALDGWLPQATLAMIKRYDKANGSRLLGQDAAGNMTYIRKNTSDDGVISKLILSQNIFKSGADVAYIKAARASIKAAHASLQNTEQDVFNKTVNTYTEALRFYEHYKIAHDREMDALKWFEGMKQKVAVGTATKTELARVEAEYASSQANRLTMQSNYETNKANLEAYIGVEIKDLVAPKELMALPKNISEAVNTALVQDPDIIMSKHSLEASKMTVHVKSGAVLPKIDLNYELDNNSRYKSVRDTSGKFTQSAQIVLTIPIFNVGPWSDIRVAKRDAAQKEHIAAHAKTNAQTSAISAWFAFESNKAALKAAKNSYEAMKLAYTGAKASEKVGVLDVFKMMEIRKDYFDSYDRYIRSKSDYYKATYQLKAAIGECTAKGLGLNVPLYDPRDNYNSIKWQLIGAF